MLYLLVFVKNEGCRAHQDWTRDSNDQMLTVSGP
jgi:hypothetical protein